MGRKPVPNYHVWHWDGKHWDLVWFDLYLDDARGLADWRNERGEASGSPHRYVVAIDGTDPVLT